MSFIDGLSTGLDTTAIIDAILAVERLPQQRAVARQERSKAASTQLSAIRTSVTNFRSSVFDLRLSSGWQQLSGTSTSDSVKVDATAGGFTGAITFKVDALATSNVIYSNTVFASLDSAVGVRGTLGEVIAEINNNDTLNYLAVAVQTGSGFRLQLASKDSGADASITLDDPTLAVDVGGFATLTIGADAQITFDGLNPYSITSPTNTFTDIMPGIDVTVSAVSATPVTVTVAHDYEKIADSVGALVEQFNEMKKAMASATRVDPGSKTQVPLAFNTNVRRSEQALLRAFVDPVAASTLNAPSLVGISLQRDGTLVFDREKFIDTAKTDIDQLTRLFTSPAEGEEDGLLDRLVKASDQAAAFGTGLLSTAEDSEKRKVEAFAKQIDAFETRFERKEASLRKLYANLEVAIGTLNNQSNWLAGQLSSLNRSNGGS